MTNIGEHIAGVNGAEKARVHEIMASLVLVLNGNQTGAEASAEHPELSTEAKGNLSSIVGVMNGKTGLESKLAYLHVVESVFVYIEVLSPRFWTGTTLNTAQVLLDLEIT